MEKAPRNAMDFISCDIFNINGKDRLLTVDNLSGYVWIEEYRRSLKLINSIKMLDSNIQNIWNLYFLYS